ncbi:tumor necrosis factor alpha-induced protein 2-like [Nematolebias whitei]|uniref:tumor necrosis factor alpha-induced protein 2-like n=1 Tax=Nematolebias whitei TaxID=451745 RepID=UPI0018976334|nr:tumor necrosis factor alpha-induced protein 2-like [Nematolebias whitei]
MKISSEGFTLNSLNQRGRAAGGWIRGKIQKIRRNSHHDVGVNTLPSTDGRLSPEDEEAPEVSPMFEQLLDEQHFSEASLLLNHTEDLLFGDTSEDQPLHHHEEELARLTAQRGALEKLLVQTLNQSLSLNLEEISNEVSVPTTALTSAVKAIHQAEEQDLKWTTCRTPNNWKKLHDSTLCSLVEGRMDNPLVGPAGPTDQSSIQMDIQNMGRQLKEDLLQVVHVVKNCYPPESNICQVYASLYHQNLSARLRKISDFVLDDKDCTFLLRWVNEFYPGILKKPELVGEIDVEALGTLLPQDLLEPLEAQYLNKQESELSAYVSQVLQVERRKWVEGTEPTMDDGRYFSPLAYDIIQFINGMVMAAQTVTGSLDRAQNITHGLTDLMQSFRAFQDDVMKQNKSPAQVKANLSCVEQFRDFFDSRRHLFPEDVQKACLEVLMDMKRSAQTFLLNPVHKVLKPLSQKLWTSGWLKKDVFLKLLDDLENELQGFQDLHPSCQQEVMGQLHQEVTQEYVRRLLRGEKKLKDREQQLKAFSTMMNHADSLFDLFCKWGSKEDWLKEILINIAEVLKLQDVPALQMQIALLGSAHPDLRENHVSSLLKLKLNISKPDRRIIKMTLMDLQRETSPANEFFSKL